ncbi:hypothetical protein A2258_01510 [Candidatus Uhrbacteria bacterium RIFOXYA2_FULL_41_8]|nr:MAG: hypothetical protein A2258_01510 [Candidatus Uhrbacteria bacterium RIFOXYA2_FULL_41_8]
MSITLSIWIITVLTITRVDVHRRLRGRHDAHPHLHTRTRVHAPGLSMGMGIRPGVTVVIPIIVHAVLRARPLTVCAASEDEKQNRDDFHGSSEPFG